MWQGKWEPSTRLWILPLIPGTPPDNLPVHTITANTQYADNASQITSKGYLIQHLHQCLFCLPKQTLIKDIKNNQLAMWPGLTATGVEKYLPGSSPSIDKDHMKRQRNGIRTTQDKLKEKSEVIDMEQDTHPPVERENTNKIFTSISAVDKKEGKIYVDNTGDFTIRSIGG